MAQVPPQEVLKMQAQENMTPAARQIALEKALAERADLQKAASKSMRRSKKNSPKPRKDDNVDRSQERFRDQLSTLQKQYEFKTTARPGSNNFTRDVRARMSTVQTGSVDGSQVVADTVRASSFAGGATAGFALGGPVGALVGGLGARYVVPPAVGAFTGGGNIAGGLSTAALGYGAYVLAPGVAIPAALVGGGYSLLSQLTTPKKDKKE